MQCPGLLYCVWWKGEGGGDGSCLQADYMDLGIVYSDATVLTVLVGNKRRELVSGTSQIVVLLTPSDPEVIFLVHFWEGQVTSQALLVPFLQIHLVGSEGSRPSCTSYQIFPPGDTVT